MFRSIPRELLWAVIISLAIFVVALWPSQYPYKQTPNVEIQQKSENGVTNQNSPGYNSAPPVDVGREQPGQKTSHDASETSVLGIKPGEWVLGIFTFMLWIATARLVGGAEITAERQLRAYVSAEFARSARTLGIGVKPIIKLQIKNFGQTPAYKLRSVTEFLISPTVPDGPFKTTRPMNHTIGPGAILSLTSDKDEPLTEAQFNQINDLSLRLFWRARFEYEDAFEKVRATNLLYEFVPDLETGATTLASCDTGNEHT